VTGNGIVPEKREDGWNYENYVMRSERHSMNVENQERFSLRIVTLVSLDLLRVHVSLLCHFPPFPARIEYARV